MQANDGQPLRGRPAQGFATQFKRASHDHKLQARARQTFLNVSRDRYRTEIVAVKTGIQRRQTVLGMGQEPVAPCGLFLSITYDQNIHDISSI